jgi:hypothetical protein
MLGVDPHPRPAGRRPTGVDVLFPTFGLFFVVVLGLVAVLIVVAVRRERARRRLIEGWALRNGWGVVRNPRVAWTARLPGGNRRGVSLLVHGTLHGRPVVVADYSYTTTTGAGDSSSTTTHRFLVVAVGLPVPYPELAVVRRGPVSRLGRALFGEGATEIGVADFDRDFRVRTAHAELSRPLVGPVLVKEHLAGLLPEWSVAGHDLLTWRPGERITDPELIPAVAAPLVRVAELLGR